MRRLLGPPLAAMLLAACASAPPEWQAELLPTLQQARQDGREVVVYFALAGRDASDKMQARLDDPLILAALARHGFVAAIADGVELARLYGEWVGGGEGMGIAVLGADGVCYAARPGPQDPEQVAAFVTMCAERRPQLAALRAAHRQDSDDPIAKHELGCLYLQLGCRVLSMPLLVDAAMAGVADARHRLARLYALDGAVTKARGWLQAAPPTAEAQATEGYVLFKERRHREAVTVFEKALQRGLQDDERQRALLYLGKSLHEAKDDERAIPILEALAREGTGSTFEAAAVHTLGHIYNPQEDHGH